MVYLVINKGGKIRKFNTLERAEKYMQKHEGIHVMIPILNYSIVILVYESKNGKLEQIKSLAI